jgi:monoterpene epsilon-lactone hydrolase
MTASAAGVPSPIETAIDRVKRVYGSWRRDTPVSQMRTDWDRLFWSGSIAADTQPVAMGGVDGLWVTAPKADPTRILIYFHGGGYKLGSIRSHLDLMVRISVAAHCRVLGVDYRLAPEHQFPAPVHDAIAVYEALLADGVSARRIAFAGDSAGGGLLAAAILALRERNRHLPVAAVMLSAWTDLTADSDSYVTRAAADPIHQRSMILRTARSYLGDVGDPRDPLASPLFGELRGFPPVLLQVGDRETVLDDSKRFAEKARAAGVEVEIEVYDNMIHVFQQFAGIVPEAQQAIDSIGRFLIDAWSR